MQRFEVDSWPRFWIACFCEIDASCHEVDEVTGLSGDAVGFGFESLGPTDNEGGGYSAGVLILFVEAERGVAYMGPTGVVTPVRIGIPWFEVFPFGAVKWASSIVRADEDEGVVEDVFFFEKGDEFARGLVNFIHHGSIGGHAPVVPCFIFCAHVIPSWDEWWARREFPFCWDESHFELFVVSVLSDFIPADVVNSLVFFVIFFGRLQWVVGRVVGDVEKEGFVWGLLERLGEKFFGKMDIGVGCIEVFAKIIPRLAIETKCFVSFKVVGCS